ncbi:MAG TPA: glycosyl transferase family 51, partial [Ramlibacter sp.]|nr:glycosyl transferase family 51 [Ramlibacter sp.]
DVVQHHMYGETHRADRILEDPDHPERAALLARFADQEGSRFLRKFYAKYQGVPPARQLDLLVSGVRATPVRLAVIFRSWAPQASFEEFREFVASQKVAHELSDSSLRTLYERYAPDRFSLADRGYLAHVHPLELWLAAHLARQPQATLTQVTEASRAERQDVYKWLFRTKSTRGQNSRILTLLEADAFAEIHRGWKRLGFPFDTLVPSYATALGSSGDRPAALAELVGVLLNDGVRLPSVQLESLHFASGTPYETVLRRKPGTGERVLPPEVAATARAAMTRVVEQGTARRVHGALVGPDGVPLIMGGKTGTGDNRLDSYGPRGALVASKAVSRTATFVFFIGDRFFGALTAYVPGPAAQDYRFTSALPVQILKNLAPQLQQLVNATGSAGCGPAQRAPEGMSLVTARVSNAGN